MAKLTWHDVGTNEYETGVSNVVLFPQTTGGAYGNGVAWNGVTAISESPSGAEPTALWADNVKYANLMSAEEFAASIEAYMSPEEFDECDGAKEIAPGVTIAQQERKGFGLCYRTLIGNDTEGTNHGYKLHLVYGALASPSERTHNSVNDSPEAETLSWEVSTTPVPVTGGKPTAHVTITSIKCDATKLKALEDILYGTMEQESRLPLPDEIATLMKTAS